MKFLILLLVFMISACGMQGDLYLPKEPAKNKLSTDVSSMAER